MYSVVIPTMWKSDLIPQIIDRLIESPVVYEIIIIDNNPNEINLNLIQKSKVVHLPQSQNIYVNPAWNLGVTESKGENVVLLSDDVDISFDFLEKLQVEKETLYGMGYSCLSPNAHGHIVENRSTNFETAVAEHRMWGFGTLMIFSKSSYIQIPDELKIWCGDDFLYDQFKFKRDILGVLANTKMSTTSNISQFDEVRNNDLRIYEQFYKNKN